MKKVFTSLFLCFIFIFSAVFFVGCFDAEEVVDSYKEGLDEALYEIESAGEELVEDMETSMTMGQRNALRKAESYLDMMAFSREGLIKQLEFEGFATEDAVFAVDRIGADWNEQAAKKAESYLDMMAFSRDGLIDQLEFEGFTYEEAVYGVAANGY